MLNYILLNFRQNNSPLLVLSVLVKNDLKEASKSICQFTAEDYTDRAKEVVAIQNTSSKYKKSLFQNIEKCLLSVEKSWEQAKSVELMISAYDRFLSAHI